MLHTADVPEVTLHYSDAIARQVTRKMIEDLGLLDVFKEKFYFVSEYRSGTVGHDNNRNPNFRDTRVTCKYVANLNPMASEWDTPKRHRALGRVITEIDTRDRIPVLYDQSTDIALVEWVQPCTMIMEIKLSFIDRVTAYSAFTRVETKFRHGDVYTVTDVQVEYPVPDETLAVLWGLQKLTGLKSSEFIDWLRTTSLNRISLNVARNPRSTAKEIVVRTLIPQMYAKVAVSGDRPEVDSTNQSADRYDINLTITTQFSRADIMMLTYPVVVNNQLIPELLVSADPEDAPGSYDPATMQYFAETYGRWQVNSVLIPCVPVSGITRLPWYDDWDVPASHASIQLGYTPKVIMLCTLDNLTKVVEGDTVPDPAGVTTVNLETGIPDHTLSEDVLTVLKAYKGLALTPSGRYFVAVFAGSDQIEPTTLSLTDGVTLVIPNRDPTKQYHVVLFKHTSPVYEDVRTLTHNQGTPHGTATIFRVLTADVGTTAG